MLEYTAYHHNTHTNVESVLPINFVAVQDENCGAWGDESIFNDNKTYNADWFEMEGVWCNCLGTVDIERDIISMVFFDDLPERKYIDQAMAHLIEKYQEMKRKAV